MKDQYNREINYLRISVTDICNYNCRYCRPNEETCVKNISLTDEEIIQIVKQASTLGMNKIRLTGGEPLLRPGIIALIKRLNEIPGIDEITMTTNGSLLQHQVKALKDSGLKRVNLSLDSLDQKKYHYITKGGNLSHVLNSIDELLLHDLKPVKINVVLMKGFNEDEIMDFIHLTMKKEITVRFIELMPIGHHDFPFKKHYLSSETVLKKCPQLISLNNDHHETATYYKLENALGKVGLISSISHHFCDNCNRIRLTSDGKVKACLHEDKEYDLLQHMRKHKGSITEFLKQCIKNKPKSHQINKSDFKKVKRNMYQIGG